MLDAISTVRGRPLPGMTLVQRRCNTEFVVPLVKAVQEQQLQIELLKKENTSLEERLRAIEDKLAE